MTVDGVAEPPRQVERVSDNFFRDLGVMPILGRMPEPSDEAVAIISYGLWAPEIRPQCHRRLAGR